MKPIIYITATPIGSLGDASSHLKSVLQEADLIICEDTRSTKKLLLALGIQNNRLESLHAHNEKEKVDFLIKKIFDGQNEIAQKTSHKTEIRPFIVALVSDAGTPAISDPGAFLIAEAHAKNIQILNVPGPSSLVCAIAGSGFYQPRIIFSAFLSRNKQKQKEEFAHWKSCFPCIAVFFESPQRILASLKSLKEAFPADTKISISREISKKFEENVVLTLENAEDFLNNKERVLGEFVICVNVTEGATQGATQENNEQSENNSLKVDCKFIAEKYNLNPKDLYSFIVKNEKIS